MFFFGDPEQLAQLYYDNVLASDSRYYNPTKHADEMSLEELRGANAVMTRAWREALREGASQEVLDAIEADYLKVFIPLLVESREFRKFVLTSEHAAVGGSSEKEAKEKCQALAKQYMTK